MLTTTTKTPNSSRAKCFVGYTRVSTERQAVEGISLAGQEDMIRAYTQKKRANLVAIYSDAASASPFGSNNRPELHDAIEQARRTGFPVIVASLDRLSRNVDVLRALRGIKLISADKGRVSQEALHAMISRAEREAQEISRRAREAHASKRSRGGVLGNLRSLPAAQRNGCLGNMARSEGKVRAISDFLARNPGAEVLPLKQLADMLNAAGIHNVQSVRKGQSAPWTVGSLKKPLKKVRDELTFQAALDAEEMTLASADGSTSPSRPDAMPHHEPAVVSFAPGSGTRNGLASNSTAMPEGTAQGGATGLPAGDQRRPLSDDEIEGIKHVMRARNLSKSDVMDELGLKRMNSSIWLSCRHRTTVNGDVIARVRRWLAANLLIAA